MGGLEIFSRNLRTNKVPRQFIFISIKAFKIYVARFLKRCESVHNESFQLNYSRFITIANLKKSCVTPYKNKSPHKIIKITIISLKTVIIQSNLRLRPPLVSDPPLLSDQFSKTQDFANQITIFGTGISPPFSSSCSLFFMALFGIVSSPWHCSVPFSPRGGGYSLIWAI